ncbi:MAG TPA: hypothetical protein VFR48_04470, partial [Solirubrobacteraceae bacterium]|nr:hypothetical protein [Solirubrobacteraceae bacterium]
MEFQAPRCGARQPPFGLDCWQKRFDAPIAEDVRAGGQSHLRVQRVDDRPPGGFGCRAVLSADHRRVVLAEEVQGHEPRVDT